METKDFPAAVVASLSSGTLLCDFGQMHEAAEYLMGHPIWTHHFADKDLWKAMQQAILAQCPAAPTNIPGVNKDNYREKLAGIEAELGDTVKIRKGNGSTARHPLEGLALIGSPPSPDPQPTTGGYDP